jgi:hypothetical protein
MNTEEILENAPDGAQYYSEQYGIYYKYNDRRELLYFYGDAWNKSISGITPISMIDLQKLNKQTKLCVSRNNVIWQFSNVDDAHEMAKKEAEENPGDPVHVFEVVATYKATIQVERIK